MDAEQLITMANDIATFYASASGAAKAPADVAGHLRRQWEPRMRRAIIELWRANDPHLSEVARGAVALLAAEAPRPQ